MSSTNSGNGKPVMNRWVIVVGAILIQVCLGAIYAWGVFATPLAAPLPDDDFQNEVFADNVTVDLLGDLAIGKDSTITLEFNEGGIPVTDFENISVILHLRDKDNKVVKSDKVIPFVGITYEEGDPITEGPFYPISSGNLYALDINVKKGGCWHYEIITQRVVNNSTIISEYDILDNTGTGEFGYTKTQTQMVFAIGLFTFALFTIFGGRLSAKFGPRKMAIAGGLVLGIGYVIASFVGGNFILLLFAVGILGGAGIGLAYVVPIAVGVKWFPDKKGMIAGLAVAGFGFGALMWMKLATGFVFGSIKLTGDWGGLIGSYGVSTVFLIYGISFAVVVILGGLVMVNPPEGWLPKGWTPPKNTGTKATGNVEFTSAQMRKTPQYYMLFFMFMVGAGAGLMVIGVITLFGKEALINNGYDSVTAGTIAVTSWAFFGSMANGGGRIAWGWISDRIGRKTAFMIMFAIQGVMMIAFFFIGGNEYLLYFAAAVIGFNFGGNFALFGAATADFFGNKSVGLNYGWVFFAYGFGGLLGPIAGGILGDNQAWMWAFVPAGVLLLVCAGVAFLLKPPKPPEGADVPEDEDDEDDYDDDDYDEPVSSSNRKKQASYDDDAEEMIGEIEEELGIDDDDEDDDEERPRKKSSKKKGKKK